MKMNMTMGMIGMGTMTATMFDILPVHTVVQAETEFGGSYRLMWRGYGRFTNLDTGSEWFVENLPTMKITIPSFTIEV